MLAVGSAMAENVHDDTATKISYSGAWNAENSPVYVRAVGGTLHETNIGGSYAEMNFVGTSRSISLVFTMHDNRGKSDIYIDGQYKDTIDARVAAPQRWQVMRTWPVQPSSVHHTIRVVARGAGPGEDINKSWSDVDAFIVDADVGLPGSIYTPDNPLVDYGGAWAWVSDSTWGNRMQSQVPGNSVRFTFYGSGVRWFYYSSGNRGIANITLDGVQYGIWDTYGTPGQERSYDIFAPTTGIHTVTLTVSGNKNAASSNVIIDVSDFLVF
jgi:hypothetical protein